MIYNKVLEEIAERGQSPEKELAEKEIKKPRHSNRTLLRIFKLAKVDAGGYSKDTVNAVKEFFQQQEKQTSLLKSDIINIRITPEERRRIEEKAQKAGLSVSEYIRRELFF